MTRWHRYLLILVLFIGLSLVACLAMIQVLSVAFLELVFGPREPTVLTALKLGVFGNVLWLVSRLIARLGR